MRAYPDLGGLFLPVIPAPAGIHEAAGKPEKLDSCLRRNDGVWERHGALHPVIPPTLGRYFMRLWPLVLSGCATLTPTAGMTGVWKKHGVVLWLSATPVKGDGPERIADGYPPADQKKPLPGALAEVSLQPELRWLTPTSPCQAHLRSSRRSPCRRCRHRR
jgi:hypothetical protein